MCGVSPPDYATAGKSEYPETGGFLFALREWPARACKFRGAFGKPCAVSVRFRCHIRVMKNFLVPVDFSSVTEDVIDSAVNFARAFEGKVVLLHVVQPPVIVTGEYALPVEVMQDAMTAGENSAKAKLAEYHELFRNTGIDCAVSVRHGPPVEVIREIATEVGADYVIMGSHGHGKLYDFLVGSTASGVIKKTKCGIIIVPPADKKP